MNTLYQKTLNKENENNKELTRDELLKIISNLKMVVECYKKSTDVLVKYNTQATAHSDAIADAANNSNAHSDAIADAKLS